jgi:multisubunit Na+/H+ antiporter MnhE subunit
VSAVTQCTSTFRKLHVSFHLHINFVMSQYLGMFRYYVFVAIILCTLLKKGNVNVSWHILTDIFVGPFIVENCMIKIESDWKKVGLSLNLISSPWLLKFHNRQVGL